MTNLSAKLQKHLVRVSDELQTWTRAVQMGADASNLTAAIDSYLRVRRCIENERERKRDQAAQRYASRVGRQPPPHVWRQRFTKGA